MGILQKITQACLLSLCAFGVQAEPQPMPEPMPLNMPGVSPAILSNDSGSATITRVSLSSPETHAAVPAKMTANSGSTGVVSAAAADDMAMTALTLMGTPYKFGGTSPEQGFDCSGLVQYIYRDISEVTLPRTAAEMAHLAGREVTVKELSVGDLLFFRLGRSSSINHVAVYIGENRFVHAPRTGTVVRIDKLNDSYWMRYFDRARRLFSDEGNLQASPRLTGSL